MRRVAGRPQMAGRTGGEKAAMADKRMTEGDVVAELRSGTTIETGARGSRRRSVSLVRAVPRSEVPDLSVVTHGSGPDVPSGGGAVDR